MKKTLKRQSGAAKAQKERKSPKIRTLVGKFLPYLAMFLVILGIAKVGSESNTAPGSGNLNVNTMAEGDYNVTTDQLSELYVVASLSSSFNLASTDAVSSNYVTVSVMKEISQTTTDKIEKPSLIDTNISRGVQTYTVAEGETMTDIAHRYGITNDQIRWSNGLKTTDVKAGQTLILPVGVAGIVYTVKSGDTPESLAKKYGSSAEQIITYNDLEDGGLAVGMRIVLPGGVLPLTERPEYVAPVVYTYSYYGSTSERKNITRVSERVVTDSGNRMQPGQCTWYAWWWRAHDARSQGKLPDGLMGNANSWASTLARMGYRVDRTPEVGAVFQTRSGWYGHVGVVLAVNGDGSIRVREMNYGYRAYVITESTIPANIVKNFNYIH